MNIYLQLLLGRQLYLRQARFIGKLCLRQDDRNGKVGIGQQFHLYHIFIFEPNQVLDLPKNEFSNLLRTK